MQTRSQPLSTTVDPAPASLSPNASPAAVPATEPAATAPETRPPAFDPPLGSAATEAGAYMAADRDLDRWKGVLLDSLMATINSPWDMSDAAALASIRAEAARIAERLAPLVAAKDEASRRLDAALKAGA